MEESLRSGGVVKKKTSSGCLIIKKKGDSLAVGGGFFPKEKKSRTVISKSELNEDPTDPARGMYDVKMLDESVVHRKREDHKYRIHGENGESDRKRSRMVEYDEYDGFGGKTMRNDRMEIARISGSSRKWSGRPSREMMVEKRTHQNIDNSSSGMSRRNEVVGIFEKRRYATGDDKACLPVSLSKLKYQKETAHTIRLQGKNGVLKVMVKKNKKMDLFSSSMYDSQVVQNGKELKSDENLCSTNKYDGQVVQYREGFKSEDDLFSSKYDGQVVQKGFKSDDVHKEKTPFNLDLRRADERGALVESNKSHLNLKKPMLEKHKKVGNSESERNKLDLQKSSVHKSETNRLKSEKHKKAGNSERERSKFDLQKLPLHKNYIVGDYESKGTGMFSKMTPPSLASRGSMKAMKREEKRPLPVENVTPSKDRKEKNAPTAEDTIHARCKKDIAKNGGSTEKQLLRERIREMLLKSGWTINYRPRKNRDYLDAVYINPRGTAYWSIIKAYEAFQKKLPETGVENQLDKVSCSFAPLSDSLINKLTRQTKKKIEREMKKKRGLDSLMTNPEKAVSNVHSVGSDDEQQENSQNGKGKHGVDCNGEDDLSVDSIVGKRDLEKTRGSSTTYSSVVHARKSRKIGQCTLLVRTSAQHSESHGYVPYMGKRTLLAWLIDSGMVQLSEKVQFINCRKSLVKLEGWITREGIHCGCCSKILTVSKFELHAGSKMHQPFQNIVLESGSSLLQCLIDAWKGQEESAFQDFCTVGADGDDPDDDTCGICGDGGDLICCDGCPSTFHLSCLGLQILPPGDWHCPDCTCKFCGSAGGNVLEEDSGTLCKLAMCNLCEKKYHIACSGASLVHDKGPLIFCGKNCQEIHDHLQKILWVKHELESGFSWSLIQRTDLDCDAAENEYSQKVEGNAKLAVALSAMDECFVPFKDRRSGINLIRNVFYSCGSNYSRLNFRGFYAIVLERGDEIISTASIRFRGAQLAEMPYIGTRHMYRRQGMCRRLLSAIESVLCSLKIEKLIIPAIAEHMDTWTTAFGFTKTEKSLRTEMKMLNLLVFPRTDWLQKPLLKQEILNADKKCTELCDNGSPVPVSPEMNMKDNNSDSNHASKISYKVDPTVPHASSSPVDKTVLHALSSSTERSDVHCQYEENKCLNAQIWKEHPESTVRLNCHSSSDTAVETLHPKNSDICHQIKDESQSSAEDLKGANIDANSLQIGNGENFTFVELQTNFQVPSEASPDHSIHTGNAENLATVELQPHLQVPSGSSHCDSFQQDVEKLTPAELQSNLQVHAQTRDEENLASFELQSNLQVHAQTRDEKNLASFELQSNLQVLPAEADEAEVFHNQGDDACFSVKYNDDAFTEAIV